MYYQLSFPDWISSTIYLPASKSISNRVLIINALSNSEIIPDNLADCDDTRVLVEALNQNGEEVVDIMASGTAMRFLTAYLSVTSNMHIITGTPRMKQRPIRILVDALRELGAEIQYVEEEGFPPLRIKGKSLTGQRLRLRGDVSSQYISALLMIAPTLKNGLQLTLTGDVISRPYIDLTLKLMEEFGVKAVWNSERSLTIEHQLYECRSYTIESDWSAASYWYEIMALIEDGEIELIGLNKNSYQGDSRVAEIFSELGVSTMYTNDGVLLKKVGRFTKYLEADLTDTPDLAQALVATCGLADVHFRFTGLQSLKIKETDRMAALITEMAKLGCVVRERNGSELIWDGEYVKMPSTVAFDTYEDHRMAMAFAPASIQDDYYMIHNPQVVSKSYPSYWEDLKNIGVDIRIVI